MSERASRAIWYSFAVHRSSGEFGDEHCPPDAVKAMSNEFPSKPG
jgi:hypothetical protein